MFHLKRRPGQSLILRVADKPDVEVRVVGRDPGGRGLLVQIIGAAFRPGPGVRVNSGTASLKPKQYLSIDVAGHACDVHLAHGYFSGRGQMAVDAPLAVRVLRAEALERTAVAIGA